MVTTTEIMGSALQDGRGYNAKMCFETQALPVPLQVIMSRSSSHFDNLDPRSTTLAIACSTCSGLVTQALRKNARSPSEATTRSPASELMSSTATW
eukprot:g37615.t1